MAGMPLHVSGPALFFSAKAEEARQRAPPGQAKQAMPGLRKRKGNGRRVIYQERSGALG